jgi:hypothetical protein
MTNFKILTIGHLNRTIGHFVQLLKSAAMIAIAEPKGLARDSFFSHEQHIADASHARSIHRSSAWTAE